MQVKIKIVSAGLLALGLWAWAGQAEARFYDPALQAAAPSLLEDVACRTVTTRTRTPSGRLVVRTRRVCDNFARRSSCRTIRERVVRPGGAVVYRTVRRCR